MQAVGLAVALFDDDVFLYRHAHDGGGEGLVVESHAREEADRGGRKFRRRLVERHDGSAGAIPADGKPDQGVINEHHQSSRGANQLHGVIGDEPLYLLVAAGLGNQPLRPPHHDGKPLARIKSPGRDKNRIAVGIRSRPKGFLCGTLRAGISIQTQRMRIYQTRAWQMDRGRRLQDGKIPTVAGNVPVELVVAGEKSKLAVGGVGDGVGVITRQHDAVFIADINPLAVASVFDMEWLRLAIAQDLINLEPNLIVIAGAVFVGSRKVAVDSMLDLFTPCPDFDRLAHLHGSILVNGDVTAVGEDLLGELIGRGVILPKQIGSRQHQRNRQSQPKRNCEVFHFSCYGGWAIVTRR